MQTFNQHILNIMVDKAISLLEKSQFADERAISFLRTIPFTINTRIRVMAGKCMFLRHRYSGMVSDIKIEISHQFCLKASDQEVYTTVTHELAHAYQLLLTFDTDHGNQWKMIDMAMGGSGEKCHYAPVQKNKVQQHIILDNRNGRLYTVSTNWLNKYSCLKMPDGKDRFVKQETYIKPQMAMA